MTGECNLVTMVVNIDVPQTQDIDVPQTQDGGAERFMGQADLTQSEEVSVSWQYYEDDLKKLCTAKAEEFHLLGYQEVTASEVWKCVQTNTKGNVPLHQWVANIINLKVGQFMNFMTMSAYRGSFPDDSFDALKFDGLK